MPLKVVKVRTDALVWSGVSHAVPKGWTPSRWGRTLVETLVSRPESSKAHRMLKRLVEDPLRGGRRELKPSADLRVTFRVRAEYWAALDSLAQAAGLKRMDYMHRALYAGSMFKGEWFTDWIEEEARDDIQR